MPTRLSRITCRAKTASKQRFLSRFATSATLIAATIAHTAAAGNIDIEQAIAAFNAELKAHFAGGDDAPTDGIAGSYARHLAPLPVESMTSAQITRLPLVFFQFGEGMSRGLQRLEDLLTTDPEDLHALVRLADLLRRAPSIGYAGPLNNPPGRIGDLLRRAAIHPRLADAVKDGAALHIINGLPALGDGDDARAAMDQRHAVLRLTALCKAGPTDPSVAVALADRWAHIRGLPFDAAERSALRDDIATALRTALSELDDAPETPQRQTLLDEGRTALTFLESPEALRDLVGGLAPELTFVWSSEPGLRSLGDLRGRVVLLNFWVTGCGHCITSIPRMQELADRYADYDVAILGVTSVQGTRHDPESRRNIDTTDDPDREFELMLEFIEHQGVSWPIAFSTVSAWNPAYEVRGTPHLTLIAPDGTVLANNMHPYHGLARNAAEIDKALQMYDLPAPPPLDPDE